MDKIQKLANVLNRINSGEPTDKVREDVQSLLEQIDATELSLAEQKLIEGGMKPEDLRGLCVVHMEMLKDELDKLRASVSPGHPLHTLITEHDSILEFLDSLEKLNASIQSKNKVEAKEVELLKELAESLISAENHHAREENALFPELEKLGITGPTRIMRMEHVELRAKKKELLSIANEFEAIDTAEFKEKVDETAKYIIFNLRDHIFKENHILYPSSLENIKEDIWPEIKKKCDEIGYCPFTAKA
jgi:Uncharacterized conserved protein